MIGKNGNLVKMFTVSLLVFLMIFAVVGCAQDQGAPDEGGEAPDETPPEPGPPVELTFATVGEGSGFYTFGIALSGMMEKYDNMMITPLVVPGINAILEVMNNKEAMIGMAGSGEIFLAYHGVADFEGKGFPEVRYIMPGYNNYMGIYTSQESGITSIADLKGKRVIWELTGSAGGTNIAKAILEANGLDPQTDVVALKAQHVTEAYAELAEGRADAIMYAFQPAVVEENKHKLNPMIIPVDQATYDYVKEKVPGLMYHEFPFDFHTLEAGVPCLGYNMVFLAHADLDEDVIYRITKVMIESYDDELGQLDFNMQQFKADTAVRDTAIAPYHPGAIKYYKEAGLWSDAMDAYNSSLQP